MIRSTLGDFSVDLNRFSEQLGIGIDKTVRKVAIDIHDGVVVKTPVDTGRARASWNIQAGSPDTSTAPERDRSEAAGAIAEAQAKQSGIGPGAGLGAIYVTNALPYIEPLEFGHSKQAPNGMARITMAEVVAGIRAVFK